MQVPPSLFRMMLLLVLKIWATIPDVSYFSVCLKLSSVLFFDLFSLTAETKVPSNSRCISITLSLSIFFWLRYFTAITSQFLNINILHPSFFYFISPPQVGMSILFQIYPPILENYFWTIPPFADGLHSSEGESSYGSQEMRPLFAIYVYGTPKETGGSEGTGRLPTVILISGPLIIILVIVFISDSLLLWEAISSPILYIMESTVAAKARVRSGPMMTDYPSPVNFMSS